MTSHRADLVHYRMKRAWETLEEADILASYGKWNACVNRLYYACFYAVSAFLLKDDFSSAKHTGIRSLFNQHYVKTGKFPKQIAWIYNALFERRHEGDYSDFVIFTEKDVPPWILDTRKFLENIEILL